MKPTETAGGVAGILGAGQLSLMLAEAARKIPLRTLVLADSASDPAASAADAVETDLGRFLHGCDLVAFENEFVDLRALAQAAGPAPRFLPSLDVIARVSDKLEQKRLFEELSLPTAPYEILSGGDVPSWLSGASRKLGPRLVLKWAKYGYDGKGCLFVDLERDAKPGARAEEFVRTALAKGTTVYAEKAVSFSRELALVASYSTRGEIAYYPLVISVQERGICKRVEGPATRLGVSEGAEETAREAARKIAERLAGSAGGAAFAGTFALELFEADDGILINEMAPRVHNTGHFSIEACPASQFENHWRALLGLRLGESSSADFFCMFNLLGPPAVARAARPGEPPRGAALHWYGKTEFRSGRKLGHVTGLARTEMELRSLRGDLERYDESWQRDCAKAPK